MKKIYTWAAKPASRTLTVGDLKNSKGKKKFLWNCKGIEIKKF